VIGRHCTPDELIDVVDGVRDPASIPHLAGCQTCNRQLNDLRRALADAESVEVPEPPPFFWQRFSARLREAVSTEAPPSRVAWWRGPSWRIAAPALAGCTVVLLALFLQPRMQRATPATEFEQAFSAEPAADPTAGWAEPADDASIGLMMDLAGSVDLDAVADAGLMTTSSATDAAVSDLSPDERLELERLLKEALNGSGA